ncbi:thymidylate synthase [Arthrobacter sp. Leaf141]|nr:thymidylate synthase [Arthrobacter sp. Leaf141]
MLSRLLVQGRAVDSRNGPALELPSQVLTVEHPTERFLHTPGRNNNPFAAIAETMWVLAGRNDLSYLTAYLKRAPEYSDDNGITWRAGYGPRLRNWKGVDQVAQVRELLAASPDSRRAVISLFDPEIDFQDSKDIPCNNWLHFLVRDGRLHLNVAARSTDIWFGFSAINGFEWSVLLEMMARWLKLDVGTLTFFTSSLHLYSGYEERARAIVQGQDMLSDEIGPSAFRYDTSWEESARAHGQWMDLEQQLRSGENLEDLEIPFDDPLLVVYIRAIDVFWAFKRGAASGDLESRLAALGRGDLAFAANEFVRRARARNH